MVLVLSRRLSLADNKNQHFVPRVHLKPFTVDGAGKAVHLFNFAADRAIRDAPLKNQCSRDYFYGQDSRLEAAIQSVEGAYATAVGRLTGSEAAPSDVDQMALRRFILLQYLRTEAASERTARFAAAVAATPGALQDGGAFDMKAAMREAVQQAMLYYARSMHVVDDLAVTLVRNRTSTPFLTSDDPAVLTNRWHLQNPRARGLSYGLRSAGLVMLLPLSPNALVMLHDAGTYSVPHHRRVTVLERVNDVLALNEHQVLNSVANIYFGDWARRDQVAAEIRSASARRPPSRHRVTYAVKGAEAAAEAGTHVRYAVRPLGDIVPEPGDEVLIHTETIRPSPSQWPSILNYRRGGRLYSNGTRTGYVRRWALEAGFASGEGYRRVTV
ncbi:MAG: DUF4238 domain-containing protein [Ignavibacteriales bacterium]